MVTAILKELNLLDSFTSCGADMRMVTKTIKKILWNQLGKLFVGWIESLKKVKCGKAELYFWCLISPDYSTALPGNLKKHIKYRSGGVGNQCNFKVRVKTTNY